jgi:MoaA/NifB/PqqE/SkfB family radical SAM enzyme
VVSQLVLTITRRCNLRCSYCPTAKDGWPSLDVSRAMAALALFVERFGGGEVKLFGGEPLLEPEVVGAVLEAARREPRIRRVYLSTNGLGLDAALVARLSADPKLVLTLSLDGRPEDHRRQRRALPGVPDSYDHMTELLPVLTRAPRVVITQTIVPATVERASENFAHLVGLGFTRFNFLPGYYLPWRPEQLEGLRRGFEAIRSHIVGRWQQDAPLYVRNLFTRAPTPFFNTGLVVDSDGSIHPTNLGLAASLEALLPRTRAGSLDDPPTPEALENKAREVNDLLARALPPRVWGSTLAVDRELGRFCRGLYRPWLAHRRRRRVA